MKSGGVEEEDMQWMSTSCIFLVSINHWAIMVIDVHQKKSFKILSFKERGYVSPPMGQWDNQV